MPGPLSTWPVAWILTEVLCCVILTQEFYFFYRPHLIYAREYIYLNPLYWFVFYLYCSRPLHTHIYIYEELVSKMRYAPCQIIGLQCPCQVHKLCFGKELFTYAYMHIYAHIYEEVFSRELDILDWRFWKELFKCISYSTCDYIISGHIHLYIMVYIMMRRQLDMKITHQTQYKTMPTNAYIQTKQASCRRIMGYLATNPTSHLTSITSASGVQFRN